MREKQQKAAKVRRLFVLTEDHYKTLLNQLPPPSTSLLPFEKKFLSVVSNKSLRQEQRQALYQNIFAVMMNNLNQIQPPPSGEPVNRRLKMQHIKKKSLLPRDHHLASTWIPLYHHSITSIIAHRQTTRASIEKGI